jgi:cytochrome c peroxidase
MLVARAARAARAAFAACAARATPSAGWRPALLLAGLLASMPFASGVADGQRRSAAIVSDDWSGEELAVLASLRLDALPTRPPDPSNAVEDRPEAVALGRRLFSDARFSRNQAVSCASCHEPALQFQDGRPLAFGVAAGRRRSMPIAGAAHATWLFWDGRKDSLWSQALGPLEDAAEHGGNRARHVHLLQAHYRTDYETVFGPMPDLAGLPEDASPLGSPPEQAAWASLTPSLREAASRVFANLGKAIAAYEKTLAYGPSRFDRHVERLLDPARQGDPLGDVEPLLTPQEANGLRLFIGKGECVTCHNGPLFTDQQFHNTGVPPRQPVQPDRGRAPAALQVQRDEFNCLGPFSDAKPDDCQELRFIAADDPSLEAAFRTPSLRNVALRPPYMHAGQFASLDEVIAHYVKAPAAVVGHSELLQAEGQGNRKELARADRKSDRRRIRLTASEARDLAAFLGTLSGPIIERPAPQQASTRDR